MYVGVPVPLSSVSVPISASILISVPVPVPLLGPVSVSVSAVVVVVVVVVAYGVVVRVVRPWREMLVMPVLPVAFIVLLLVVFPDVRLHVPAVMLPVVMVVLVVAVVMVVVVAPVVVANVLLVLLHHVLHVLLPLLRRTPAGRPLVIIPAGVYVHPPGGLAVLGVALVLHSAVVMVVVVVHVLGPLRFGPQEVLFLLSLTLLSPLLMSLG